MKIKTPKIKIKFPVSKVIKNILKYALLAVYAAACLIVIIPSIDHQDWYPWALGTHDIKLGPEFGYHKQVEIDLKENSLNQTEYISLTKAINKRAKIIGFHDYFIEQKDNILSLHVPSETEDSLLANIITSGKVELLKPNNPESFQTDPTQMFDKANYSDSGLDLKEIENARVVKEESSNVYIELKIEKGKIDKWDKVAQELLSSNLGIFVDDQLRIGWLMSSTLGQYKNPVIVVSSTRQDAELLANMLTSEPILNENVIYTKNDAKPLVTTTTLYLLAATMAFLIVVFALLDNPLVNKNNFRSLIVTAFGVLGLAAIIKLSPVVFSLTAIITGFICFVYFILLNKKNSYVTTVSVLLLGIFLVLIKPYGLYYSSYLIIVTTIYTILFRFFLEFTNIDEKE